MPVTSSCNRLLQSRRDLYQLLAACQEDSVTEDSVTKDGPRIFSVSLDIGPVDPLAVLHQLAQPNELNFYFEKRNRESSSIPGRSIAAIGSVDQLQVQGRHRFAAANEFVQATSARTRSVGDDPLGGPYWFCSFTFSNDAANQDNPFPAATVFLPRWQVIRQDDRAVLTVNLVLHSNRPLAHVVDETWETIQAIKAIRYEFPGPVFQAHGWTTRRDVTDTQHFKQAVRSIRTAIQRQDFHKLVLAHAIDVRSPLPFQTTATLHNLRTLYPDCYTVATSSGTGHTFVSASPERLVSLRDRQLYTDALAGSAPRGKTTDDDAAVAEQLLHSAKDLHEHQLVVDFISGCLQQLGLTPERSPLRLLRLPNIQHLHTPLRAVVPPQVSLLDIVAALHPTPAVAGVPRDLTCQQIRRYEQFERSLYAGAIGWLDHQGNGEFIVGIRSALIDGCCARLFAGAGIVAGSDPEQELAEVQLKLQALLQAIV
ncbi:isochorismate synthase [Leptolyngbya sp. FACHB-36]|uniref:isochorismate synthase n=1 Tax=Leptolyngbya sp. FACHB-36 TaxID=2692808 RepID=UPI001680E594|nr:isochorismate synthase [Leptolyngbya sp. FACHB-36]MBD2022139.1 isochorismate synthase [Leptolyngbya sp. FACHB-36]